MASLTKLIIFIFLISPLCFSQLTLKSSAEPSDSDSDPPKPTPWPHQFHSILFMNHSGIIEMIDLWYDWPNGRNFNIIQHQLGKLLYDLEWNNGTSFFYTLDSNRECRSAQLEVGILRPDWLDGANYLGQKHVNGFLCNVWEKADFISYYEDVVTKRPVLWVFYTGREAHVMTFEVGAALEDAKWQAPVYCFRKQNDSIANEQQQQQPVVGASHERLLGGGSGVLRESLISMLISTRFQISPSQIRSLHPHDSESRLHLLHLHEAPFPRSGLFSHDFSCLGVQIHPHDFSYQTQGSYQTETGTVQFSGFNCSKL